MIGENLCVYPGVNLERVKDAPQVMEAAKAYARELAPHGLVYVTSGYRSAKQQRARRRSGVQAGPSAGRNMSAHLYGTALDLQIKGDDSLRDATCQALINVMPIIGPGGGVIHEGCGGGSCDVHLDDNWGTRHWDGKMVMYASKGNCSDSPRLETVENTEDVALIRADSAPDTKEENGAAPGPAQPETSGAGG